MTERAERLRHLLHDLSFATELDDAERAEWLMARGVTVEAACSVGAEQDAPREETMSGPVKITFNELVAHGILSGAPLTRGMPWSFEYKGNPITHENDDCYLIPVDGGPSAKLRRGDLLCANHIGDGNSFWWHLGVERGVGAVERTTAPVGTLTLAMLLRRAFAVVGPPVTMDAIAEYVTAQPEWAVERTAPDAPDRDEVLRYFLGLYATMPDALWSTLEKYGSRFARASRGVNREEPRE